MTVTVSEAIDPEAAYRACSGREARFDGRLFLGVTSTGIYCRPSCPARTPRPEHCRFFRTAAACVAAGFRACKRCRPDAVPGSSDWDSADDLAGRALRLIRDGAADDAGIAGLAARLHVSERQLRRVVVEATGATPLQLAATRRAAVARQLVEQTDLSLADVAFAAGYRSVRRFNDAMRAEFGVAPSRFERRRGFAGAPATTRAHDAADDARQRAESAQRPIMSLRLRYRPPLAVSSLRAYLADHAIAGFERAIPDASGHVIAHERVVPVPGGSALARVEWPEPAGGPGAADGPVAPGARDAAVTVRLDLPRLDDLMPAIAAVRRWLDLDADPGLVDAALSADPRLAPLIAERPGLRIPGSVDPVETALMVVLGQQVSVRSARRTQARCAAVYGVAAEGLGSLRSLDQQEPLRSLDQQEPLRSLDQQEPLGSLDQQKPLRGLDTAAIAADGVANVRARLGIDGNRAAGLVALADAIRSGLHLGPDADRAATRGALLALPRIGPWTADLIALRCLGDPDVFASGDLIARRAVARLAGLERITPRAADAIADAWRPWRGYALMHLWSKEFYP